jgi:hypothetical protein
MKGKIVPVLDEGTMPLNGMGSGDIFCLDIVLLLTYCY